MTFFIQSLFVVIPIFTLLIIIEEIISRFIGKKINRATDMVSSLSSGITNITKDGMIRMTRGTFGLKSASSHSDRFQNVPRYFAYGGLGSAVVPRAHRALGWTSWKAAGLGRRRRPLPSRPPSARAHACQSLSRGSCLAYRADLPVWTRG